MLKTLDVLVMLPLLKFHQDSHSSFSFDFYDVQGGNKRPEIKKKKKKNTRWTHPFALVRELVTVGIEDGHNVDVDVLEDVAVARVLGELLDRIDGGRRCDPFARVDTGVNEQGGLVGLAAARELQSNDVAALEAFADAEEFDDVTAGLGERLQVGLDLCTAVKKEIISFVGV